MQKRKTVISYSIFGPASFLDHVQSLKAPRKHPYIDFYIQIRFITTLASMTLDLKS